MKFITEDLKNIIQDDTINLVRCWKIKTKNNELLAFSTADIDFEYDNILFHSISGNDIKEQTSNIDVEKDELILSLYVNNNIIKEKDILSGKYDNAEVEVFIVDLLHLDKQKITLINGNIDSITLKNQQFIANVSGLKNQLNKIIGDVYSPICRARFCDNKCKLSKINYTYSAEISTIYDNRTFFTNNKDILSKNNGYFDNGIITFKSGLNKNNSIGIRQFTSGNFTLILDTPYKMEIGDKFEVIAGCDKQFNTCINKFNNAINFRGEPHLPGIELLLKVK